MSREIDSEVLLYKSYRFKSHEQGVGIEGDRRGGVWVVSNRWHFRLGLRVILGRGSIYFHRKNIENEKYSL
jgi:hypothetical protein